MQGIKNIWGKEIARILKDKKMIFSVFLLPVLMMIGIMAIMNVLINNMQDSIENHQAIIYVENQSENFETFLEAGESGYTLIEVGKGKTREDVENSILEGTADLLIEFPKDFDEKIISYTEGNEVPQIKTFFNPSEEYSQNVYSMVNQLLETYRQELLGARIGNMEKITVFTVNTDNEQMIIQDEQKAGGKALAMMLPYFITLLLFAGAMGIGTDMVAGEKERGTMASLLMTPVKRSSIALGKVFALMSLTGLSSLISVIAMVVTFPLMGQAMGDTEGSNIRFDLTISQILMIGILLIAIAFLYATIIVLISVFAKDVKEASSYVMPVYMLVLVLGMATMFQTGETAQIAFFVPIYNVALVLGGILSQETTILQYVVTLGMTMGISIVLIGMIVKAFKSEKVMSA